MLNFDEFKASSARERAQAKLAEESKTSKVKKTTPVKEAEKQTKGKEGSSSTLGDFLEMPQLQSFVIVLIVLDSFVAFAEVFASNVHTIITTSSFLRFIADKQHIIVPILQSFTGFTLSFFCVELLSIMLIFRMSIVGHLGYCIDILVIVSQLYLELQGYGRETRLLNIFRYWRLARLFYYYVNIEKELHDGTREQLAGKENEIAEHLRKILSLQSDLAKETEAKGAVESMLQGYKDEVETLNEALKIAAMDIAEVAQADDDLLLTDDDDDDDDAEDVEEGSPRGGAGAKSVFVDAASSEYDSLKGRGVILQESMKAKALEQGNIPSSTIVINEDGTFARK